LNQKVTPLQSAVEWPETPVRRQVEPDEYPNFYSYNITQICYE